MVEANEKLDAILVDKILSQNYSKIPVYEGSRDRVIGFVKSKKLLLFDINNPKSFREGNAIMPAVQMNYQ